MKPSRRVTETRRAEMVETHNLVLSIERLRDGIYDERWKRALYHAVTIVCTRGEAEKIRQALELP